MNAASGGHASRQTSVCGAEDGALVGAGPDAVMQALGLARRHLDLLARTTGAGMWSHDLQRGVMQPDGRWRALLGYAADDAFEWGDLVDPDDRERLEEAGGLELPFGVMLTATLGHEELLLALSAQLEAADPWEGHAPPAPG